MIVSKVTTTDEESWITIRSGDDYLVIHIDREVSWELKGSNLNIKVK